MKTLKDILLGIDCVEIIGSTEITITSLCIDSRKVVEGSMFIAQKGTQVDGHLFIKKAIELGATAIVCEDKPADIASNVTYVIVSDTHKALGRIASNFFQNPSQKLKLIGITGTNGKTTTATLLYRIASQLGYKSGLISTVQNIIGETTIPSTHTTPHAIDLNNLLSQMVEEGCSYCFMEVSSHAIHQHRIAGLNFTGAIFSNISHDHLDYHNTFKEYIAVKKSFFDTLPSSTFALVNMDDRNGMVMTQNTKAKVYTYSLKSMATYRCKIIEQLPQGMLLNINGVEVWSRLIGEFNAYNILAAYATTELLEFNAQETLAQISSMGPVDGRFENFIAPNGIIAIVDYAHTPDAIENVIETIGKIKQQHNRLITVLGAGGNRDKTKRPLMARAALVGSDLVILTSDNPRNEDPNEIINDMKKGVDAPSVGKVLTIPDRKEAIRTACLLANKGDIVLVAGKGHENYQEINGVKYHFDDREIISEVFKTIEA